MSNSYEPPPKRLKSDGYRGGRGRSGRGRGGRGRGGGDGYYGEPHSTDSKFPPSRNLSDRIYGKSMGQPILTHYKGAERRGDKFNFTESNDNRDPHIDNSMHAKNVDVNPYTEDTETLKQMKQRQLDLEKLLKEAEERLELELKNKEEESTIKNNSDLLVHGENKNDLQVKNEQSNFTNSPVKIEENNSASFDNGLNPVNETVTKEEIENQSENEIEDPPRVNKSQISTEDQIESEKVLTREETISKTDEGRKDINGNENPIKNSPKVDKKQTTTEEQIESEKKATTEETISKTDEGHKYINSDENQIANPIENPVENPLKVNKEQTTTEDQIESEKKATTEETISKIDEGHKNINNDAHDSVKEIEIQHPSAMVSDILDQIATTEEEHDDDDDEYRSEIDATNENDEHDDYDDDEPEAIPEENPSDIGIPMKDQTKEETLKLPTCPKEFYNKYNVVNTPAMSNIRKKFNIIMDHNVIPILTSGSDLNDWLNHLQLALILFGHPGMISTVMKSIKNKTAFNVTNDPELEYYIKLLLRKYVSLDELILQSSLLSASEQIANVIMYATSVPGVELNSTLYLFNPIEHTGYKYNPRHISPMMESYLNKLKYNEFYILKDTDDFYDWFISTKLFLSQMGIDDALNPIINMLDFKVLLTPLKNVEAEFFLKMYCLKTVEIIQLDASACAERMLHRVFNRCQFIQTKEWIISRMASLTINCDNFDKLREDYYSCLTYAKVRGLDFEPRKAFNTILKRSSAKYRRFGEEYLKNNPNSSSEAFFDYLESSNSLVYDVGAQFELDELQRKPLRKRRGGKSLKRKRNH